MLFTLEIRRPENHIIIPAARFPPASVRQSILRMKQHVPHMKTNILLSILCLLVCAGAASCRSTPEEVESGAISEVLEIEGCVLSEPCVLVTRDVLDTLPEGVRAEAKKYCGDGGTVVVASSLRPRYFRLVRQQNRLLLGSVEVASAQKIVYLSVICGLGGAADSIRSIKIENPGSPDTWDLGIFIKRYPELAARIGAIPPGDGRLAALGPATKELLSRGSTRVMLERHSREKDPAEIEAAEQAEQEQIGVVEDILNSK